VNKVLVGAQGRAAQLNRWVSWRAELTMGAKFWIRRFIAVFFGALTIIAGAQMLRGRGVYYAITQGLLWATISASVFTLGRMYQSNRGQHCAICNDTPDIRRDGHGET
jgi:hypothetical protein